VRGETVEQTPGDVGPQVHPNAQAGSLYIPPREQQAAAVPAAAAQPTLSLPSNFGSPAVAPSGGEGSLPKPASRKDSKPRAIDALMEEMRAAQQAREAGTSTAHAGALPNIVVPGLPFQHDTGSGSKPENGEDQTTTNLYVGNLATDVTEEILGREFGAFGAINSVKIMWPRNEDEQRRTRHCGFVSFMDRPTAQAAHDAMEGPL